MGSPCSAVGRARGLQRTGRICPQGSPPPPRLRSAPRTRGHDSSPGRAIFSEGLRCVALGSAPQPLNSRVSTRTTTLSQGGPRGCGRLDSTWWASSRAQAALRPLPSPQERPLATGRKMEEGCGPGAGSPAALTGWAGAPPGLGRASDPDLSTSLSATTREKGRESLGGGAGVEAEQALEAEHPNVWGLGSRARRGRHPRSRGLPCSSWWSTLFSHWLFFSGGPECSLPPPQGRPGGQAHCTCTGGWTHVRMCVCACVCVLPPPRGRAGWGPWALGHRPHPPLGLLVPSSQPSGGVGPALPCGGSGSAGGDRSSARGHVGGGPGPGLDGGHPHLALTEGA